MIEELWFTPRAGGDVGSLCTKIQFWWWWICFYLPGRCFLTTTSQPQCVKKFLFSCWKSRWPTSWRSWPRPPPTVPGWRRSWTRRGRRPTTPGRGPPPSPSWGCWCGFSGGGGQCWQPTSHGSPRGTHSTGNLQHNIISLIIIPRMAK